MNCLSIMNESVLVRKVEPSVNTSSLEDFAVVVVTVEGFIHLFKTPNVMNVAVG